MFHWPIKTNQKFLQTNETLHLLLTNKNWDSYLTNLFLNLGNMTLLNCTLIIHLINLFLFDRLFILNPHEIVQIICLFSRNKVKTILIVKPLILKTLVNHLTILQFKPNMHSILYRVVKRKMYDRVCTLNQPINLYIYTDILIRKGLQWFEFCELGAFDSFTI